MQKPAIELLDIPQIHQTSGLLPLIDHDAVADWCQDLEPTDVRDILARVPAETLQSMELLARAIELKDLTMARRAAHRIKGMAANLGATRLSHDAKDLELSCSDINEIAARFSSLDQTMSDTLTALAELAPAT